jgi:sterol 24-C-methyltransferase
MAMDGDTERIKSFIGEDAIPKDKVKEVLENYNRYYTPEKGGNVELRKKDSISLVKDFYNLVTHFYEFGWGQSFHFAPRHKWESFAASIGEFFSFTIFLLFCCLVNFPSNRVLSLNGYFFFFYSM